MPRASLQFWHLVVIVLLAAMLGTAVGDILGKAFPEGPVGRFLSAGVYIGTTTPWDLDLRVLQITVGLGLRLSLLGGLGAGVALLVFFRRL
jgi:hypothetical protein